MEEAGERKPGAWKARWLVRFSGRHRRWAEVGPAAQERLRKQAAGLSGDYRVAVEEFLAAYHPLVERLFLDRRLFWPPPRRITPFTVRFCLLTLTLASIDRSLAKFPELRAQLPEVFAPLYDEPTEAVRARLKELAERTPGVSVQELWEMAGKLYGLMKHVVYGAAVRVNAEEMHLMEKGFRQAHELAVRRIARRLAGASAPRT